MIDEERLKELLKSVIENAHAVNLIAVGAAKETGASLPGYSVEEVNRMYQALHERLDEAIPDDDELEDST